MAETTKASVLAILIGSVAIIMGAACYGSAPVTMFGMLVAAFGVFFLYWVED